MDHLSAIARTAKGPECLYFPSRRPGIGFDLNQEDFLSRDPCQVEDSESSPSLQDLEALGLEEVLGSALVSVAFGLAVHKRPSRSRRRRSFLNGPAMSSKFAGARNGREQVSGALLFSYPPASLDAPVSATPPQTMSRAGFIVADENDVAATNFASATIIFASGACCGV